MRKQIILQWLQIVGGLLVFSFGVHMTIFANIGLAPWDCLGMAVSYHTPLNFGLAMTLLSVVILAIDLLLKERIGFGTIIDALLTGNLIQLFNDLNPYPLNQNMWIGIVILLIAFLVMGFGMWIYMSAAQGCGPRDALLVGLGKRVPKIPIGIVEIVLLVFVVLISWFLGGPIGIGTLISMVGEGLGMQTVYSIVHFEPRDVRNKDVIETARMFSRGEQD